MHDSARKGVQVFTKEGKFVRTFANKESDGYVFAFFVFKTRILVTGDSTVKIFDSNYNYVSQIAVSGFSAKYICFLGEEFLLVTTMQNTILTLDWNGNVVAKFGSRHSGQFSDISGICINSQGHILVIDSKYGVQIFSKDWKLLSCFNPGKDDLAKFASESHIPEYIKRYMLQRKKTQMPLLSGLVVGPNDNIFLVDESCNKLCIFTPSGDLIKQIPISNCPKDILLLGRRLFVSCNGSICVFTNEHEPL